MGIGMGIGGGKHPDWDEWTHGLQQMRPQSPKPAPKPPTPAQQLSEREQKRLHFLRWLRDQGRMRDDSCLDCGGTRVIGDGYICPSCT